MTDTQQQVRQAPIQSNNMGPLITASVVTMGGAVTTVITYILQQVFQLTLPQEVDGAILVIIEAVLAWASHRYFS